MVGPPDQIDPVPPANADESGRQADALLPLVYEELRALADRYLNGERANHTLQPTALVHEAYLRLTEIKRLKWDDRGRFLTAAAGAIRRVLVDHARARNTAKRGGGAHRLTLSAASDFVQLHEIDVLALHESLEALATLDARKARVVDLRFFGGLTIDETAHALGVSTTTVEDDWAFARAWLKRRLSEDQV